MKNLQLSLKSQWFEMTKAGIKKEDYREINDYWVSRLFKSVKCKADNVYLAEALSKVKDIDSVNKAIKEILNEFSTNIMTLGYPKSTDTERILKLEHKGIEIGYGNPEWGAEPNKLYFIIKHGEIIK